MNIVLIGAKASGKSTLGKELAKALGTKYVETDEILESLYDERNSSYMKCNEIFDSIGEEEFRELEKQAVRETLKFDYHVVITGGSTFLSGENRSILRRNSLIIYCYCDTAVLTERLENDIRFAAGLSKAVFLDWYKKDIRKKDEIYSEFADIIMDLSEKTPSVLAEEARERINGEISLRVSSPNTFGDIIRLTTFGESHGPAIGAVLDGLPSGMAIDAEDIQKELDRRRPGQSRITTPRKEKDRVRILSGLFNGKTTGAPIALLIENKDSDSSKYESIKDLFRPGHADFSFFHKYATRDYRGGGRSSGRETASRVAGGSIARKILFDRGVAVTAHTIELCGIKAEHIDYDEIEKNMIRSADGNAASKMIASIDRIRSESDSVGGIVQLDIKGLPPGLGDPVFAKLDARLCYAIMTIGAIKGVEIGEGFQLARRRGSESNDPMESGGFVTNNAGGILGGISTGQDVVLRIAVKPTPSISKVQKTIDKSAKNTVVSVQGRHDPCIVPRVIPVIESMAALVLIDAWQIQSRLNAEWNRKYGLECPEV
jgi:chorismate synthase